MDISRNQIRWNGWGWTAHRDILTGREEFWRWLADEMGMPALLATPARPLEELSLPAPRLGASRIAAFAAITGADRVHQDDYQRAFHARGRSYQDLLRLRDGDLSSAPDVVIYPRGEEEVVAILKVAAAEKIAVIPFGGGTGPDGGVTGRSGAVTLDLSGMDRVIAIDIVSGLVTAEAGIYGPALERALAVKGLTLGDPQQNFEFSSLGGWIANSRAAQEGGRAIDWLAGVRLATAHGILEFGGDDAPAAGPDLKSLLLGSQGALGIVTQAHVRARRIQPLFAHAFLFRDFASGSAAIREAIQAGIAHRMLRLCDAEETYVMRAFAPPEESRGLRALLERLADPPSEAGEAILTAGFSDANAARRFGALAKTFGARDLGEGPAQAWIRDRPMAPYLRDPLLDRGVGFDTLEMGVRWSALPTLYAAVKGALEKAMRDTAPLPRAHGIVLAHIGHAYADGASLTFTFLFPRNLNDEIAQARTIRRAAGLHPEKNEERFPSPEKNAPGIAALRALKNALDPDGILNPGKIFV